jgi:hypothetical protein
MNNRYVYLSLTLMLAVVCFPGADARNPSLKAQPVAKPSPTKVTRKMGLNSEERKIVSLIAHSPFVYPKPKNALGGEDFMRAASEFGIPESEKGSPLDVLRALEAKISRVGPVIADVSSTPTNLSVRYYRLGDVNLKLDTFTDNSAVQLDPPATYVFECTGPGGVIQKKQVPCPTGCTVRFTF